MDNLKNLPARSSEPFPVLTDASYSASTVQILKNLCYDRFSELTAAMTYLYQDWSLYPTYPDIANALEQISIVEMTHLDVLSNAIVAFGGKPNYIKDGKVWSASAVDQNLALPEVIYQNIYAEQCAIEDYQKAIASVSNESLKKIFEKIISDELTHITIFEEILRDLNAT